MRNAFINQPVVFLDSGAGGLSVLKRFTAFFPNEKAVYFGDGQNAPYGNKSKETLKLITEKNLREINALNPKLLIVSCNTLSLSIGTFIKEKSTAPVVFTLPPVHRITISNIKDCVIFCTALSAKCPPISRLANICSTLVQPLPYLAEDIEKAAPYIQNVNLKNHGLSADADKKYVFLACTHFALIKNKFSLLFPRAEIFDGTDEVNAAAAPFLTKRRKSLTTAQISFIGSGFLKYSELYALL